MFDLMSSRRRWSREVVRRVGVIPTMLVAGLAGPTSAAAAPPLREVDQVRFPAFAAGVTMDGRGVGFLADDSLWVVRNGRAVRRSDVRGTGDLAGGAVSRSGELYAVRERPHAGLSRRRSDGVMEPFGPPGEFSRVVADGDELIAVEDQRILRLDGSGGIIGEYPTGGAHAFDVAPLSRERIAVLQTLGVTVHEIGREPRLVVRTAGVPPSSAYGRFSERVGFALATVGDTIWVADEGNFRMQAFDLTGRVVDVCRSTRTVFNGLVGERTGRLWVFDRDRIREFRRTGAGLECRPPGPRVTAVRARSTSGGVRVAYTLSREAEQVVLRVGPQRRVLRRSGLVAAGRHGATIMVPGRLKRRCPKVVVTAIDGIGARVTAERRLCR